jgi:hypothetical protein
MEYEVYRAVWKVLADLVTELRKRGEEVPAHVIGDLRAAKTMIELLKMVEDPSESVAKIEGYLGSVEAYLISTAQGRFGDEYAEAWMRRMAEIRRGPSRRAPEAPRRFVPGLPRDRHWVRLKVSEDLPREKVELLAREMNLQVMLQEDGYMLVSGGEGEIKDFVKKMAHVFRKG